MSAEAEGSRSLADDIAMLTARVAEPWPGDDVPAIIGILAGTYLEWFEEDGDADLLDHAIELFRDALASQPRHAELPTWYFGLGVAHGYRAALAPGHSYSGASDHDQAIHWLGRHHELLSRDDPRQDLAVVLLVDAIWDRFTNTYDRQAGDQDPAMNAALAVAHAVGRLEVPDGEPAAYARLICGLATAAAFEMGGGRPLLDQAIDLLEDALGALPASSPRFAWSARELVEAYEQRAKLDDDPSSLDAAIAAGESFLREISADDPDVPRLHFAQSSVYEDRWRITGKPADLDQAIIHARAALGGEPHSLLQVHCGGLLYQRAEATRDPAFLDEAIDRLVLALEDCPQGDPDWWLRQHDLARAHQLLWQLTHRAGSLDLAMSHFDLSLTQRAPEADFTLLIHQQRTWAACEQLHYQANQPHTDTPPAALLMRRYLDEAHAALEDPLLAIGDRAGLDATIAFAELYVAGFLNAEIDVDRLLALVKRAEEVIDDDEWRNFIAAVFGMLDTANDGLNIRSGSNDGGVTDLAKLAPLQPAAEFSLAREVLPMAALMRALRTGDLRALRAAVEMMRQQASAAGGQAASSFSDRDLDVWADLFAAIDAAVHDDPTEAGRLCAKAQAALEDRPPSHSSERLFRPVFAVLQAFLPANAAYTSQGLPPLPSGAALTGLDLAGWLSVATQRLQSANAHGDLAMMRDCTENVAQVAGRLPAGGQLWLMATALAGLGELAVARLDPADRRAAARGARWYEQLLAENLSGHPMWIQINLHLAEALRLAGDADRARTRRLGFAALRAHGRMALLQSGTDHAIESARAVSADARKVASWCLEDGDYEQAVAALDAGRGLAVHAATVSRNVADLLRQAGHHDLATEWQGSQGLGRDQLTGNPLRALPAEMMAATAEVPDDLRARVLLALDSAPTQELLTPITSAQVRAALTTVGADALVYLIANDDAAGFAMIVEAGGAISVLNLPHLSTGTGSAFTNLAATAGLVRDLNASPTAHKPRHEVEPLCQWAWQAAIGPLIDHAARWRLGRPARLVLVPMGSLALVPWHAAYTVTGQTRRHAVEELVVSYSVSAQVFCTTAARPSQPACSALVVGDPQGNLPFAGAEAQAIHSQFYPYGRYLSGPHTEADGTATPEQVLDWISSGARAPSTLHFACHAAVDADRPAGAHLALHGGNLTARRLVEASRIAELVMNRVFLAACTTNVTGTDYDEAFSLATAFLAAGAHTVFGSLWAVADEDTSVLMFMVHHYLNTEGLAPADALNRAQRWMIDPLRVPPPTMPPSMRHSATSSHCADLESWAAFTHLGR